VDNFKSLVNFELPLEHFTCLIGLNGSGKSTVLQAIDFLSELFSGDIDSWLERRHWKVADLNCKLSPVPARNRSSRIRVRRKSNISFSLVLDHKGRKFHWTGNFNRVLMYCTHESVTVDGETLLQVNKGHYSLGANGSPEQVKVFFKIFFKYQGSVLSQLTDDVLPKPLLTFRRFMQQTTSLDLLAPQYLRQRTRESGGGLGLGGERLSAFLHELSPRQLKSLEKHLIACYPQLQQIRTSSLRSGWKQLKVEEKFAGHRMESEARHINDGMLRLMAILAETLTDARFLLFDEIENGINPELVEFLIDSLVGAKQQILVTTHSPMILNYLDDDVARKGVQYLYKTPKGHTRSIPFFSIPSLARKLEVMGPGEAFIDTELSKLPEEISQMDSVAQEGDDAASAKR
jgi:ABC-type multidrug transport system ATPase subunit